MSEPEQPGPRPRSLNDRIRDGLRSLPRTSLVRESPGGYSLLMTEMDVLRYLDCLRLVSSQAPNAVPPELAEWAGQQRARTLGLIWIEE